MKKLADLLLPKFVAAREDFLTPLSIFKAPKAPSARSRAVSRGGVRPEPDLNGPSARANDGFADGAGRHAPWDRQRGLVQSGFTILLRLCRAETIFVVLAAAPAQAAPPAALWTEARHHQSSHASKRPDSFVKLARALQPAVVSVIALDRKSDLRPPPAPEAEHGRSRGRGQGTGFVLRSDGLILTNCHVVEGAGDIRVRLEDDREIAAQLIGKDERTDIALLKIVAPKPLAVASLGNSDELQIGEWVVAIGNPFGLDHTVTAGIVSAKGRRDVRPGPSGFYDFIQTDASINPGNSGGPLVNTRGEVVGMNTAINAQAQGIGFAIPINMVKVIVPLLKQHGRAPRSWLGIFPQSMNAALKRAFSLQGDGALVAEVVEGSPAALGGVQIGDVVTEFSGHSIRRADDLLWLVATTEAQKPQTLTLRRGSETKHLQVRLIEAPEDHEAASPPAPRHEAGHQSPLGIVVAEISPTLADELGNSKLRGVVVLSVEPDSPAIESGIERGDVLLRVGAIPIQALEDYGRAVRAVKTGDMLRMLIVRDGRNQWLAFPKR